MTLTMKQVLEIDAALEQEMRERLPFVLSFKLSRVRDKLESDIRRFKAAQGEMIRKYGENFPEKGADYFEVLPTSPNMPVYRAELQQMFEVEVTAELDPLTTAELENVTFKGESVYALLPIITK